MTITAAQVKELRERTNVAMMDCKKALEKVGGDMELAIEELRKSGQAKASKKASRVASEGAVIIKTTADGKTCVLIEINSETDFVGRDENFLKFADAVAQTALTSKEKDVATLLGLTLVGSDTTVEEARQALVAKVGENISIRRIEFFSGDTTIGSYSHGGRIGVLVQLDTENQELAKDIAMHIAASKPLVVAPENVSAELVAKEKEIYMAQAAGSGKPQEILEKMVAGKLKKFLDEVSLIGQPFVKDPDTTISNLLNKHKAKVVTFVRFEVGEGIEKETEDFVDAVMNQARGG